jgi:hypothetical protein
MLAVMARKPLRDGWRVLQRAPEAVLAEIAWRWAFGAAFWTLLILSFHSYFSTIQISRAEYAAMKSLEPFTWVAIAARLMQAVVEGVRKMGPILFPALSVLWLALATMGRGVTVRALSLKPRTNWLALVGTNVFRLLMTFAAMLAYVGAAILVSRTFDPQRFYVLNILLMLAVVVALVVIWSVVNWFVSLAQIVAARNGEGLVRSIRSAGKWYQAQSGEFVSSGVLFSLIRFGMVMVVTVASLAPLGNMTVGGAKPVMVFIAIVSLLYFAAADALNIWRLGVYIGLMEPGAMEEAPVVVGA